MWQDCSYSHMPCRMFTCDTGGSLTSVLHLYHYRVRLQCGSAPHSSLLNIMLGRSMLATYAA